VLSGTTDIRDRSNTASSIPYTGPLPGRPRYLFSVIGPSIRCISRPFFSCLANFWREPTYVPFKHAPAQSQPFGAIKGHSVANEVVEEIAQRHSGRQNGPATIEGSSSENAAEREFLVFHLDTEHYFPPVQPTEIILYVQTSFIKEATLPPCSSARSGHGEHQGPGRRL